MVMIMEKYLYKFNLKLSLKQTYNILSNKEKSK